MIAPSSGKSLTGDPSPSPAAKDISEHMRRAMDTIRAQGGSATPEGGGWWKGADGKRLRHQNVALGGDYQEPVVTRTIYALARRNILKRTGKHAAAWRDTYVIAS